MFVMGYASNFATLHFFPAPYHAKVGAHQQVAVPHGDLHVAEAHHGARGVAPRHLVCIRHGRSSGTRCDCHVISSVRYFAPSADSRAAAFDDGGGAARDAGSTAAARAYRRGPERGVLRGDARHGLGRICFIYLVRVRTSATRSKATRYRALVVKTADMKANDSPPAAEK
jgi:hypothetical protein